MSTNGLRVGVTDLLRHPGERRAVEREVDLPGLAISTARVPDGEPVVVELEIESLSTELAVYGTVRAPFVGECRRCLRDVRGVVEVEVREIFELHPTEGETYLLSRDVADLEPMVRDAVLLALPLAPLCADDCRGPAPDQFPAEVEPDEVPHTSGAPDGAGDADERPPDPRWAALDQLHLD